MPVRVSRKAERRYQRAMSRYGSARDLWEYVGWKVADALNTPEHCPAAERYIGNLGPPYDDIPELILSTMDRWEPEYALKILMEIDPDWELETASPTRTTAAVVEAIRATRID